MIWKKYRREVSKIEDTSLRVGMFSFRSSSCFRLVEFKLYLEWPMADHIPCAPERLMLHAPPSKMEYKENREQ